MAKYTKANVQRIKPMPTATPEQMVNGTNKKLVLTYMGTDGRKRTSSYDGFDSLEDVDTVLQIINLPGSNKVSCEGDKNKLLKAGSSRTADLPNVEIGKTWGSCMGIQVTDPVETPEVPEPLPPHINVPERNDADKAAAALKNGKTVKS